MRIFLEKGCKITEAPGFRPRWPPAARDSAPRSPRSYSHLLI